MPFVPFRKLYQSILNETAKLSGKVFLSDGGMGTELMKQGVEPSDILQANIYDAPMVSRIHEAYIEAGADIITANTFGAWSDESEKQGTAAILAGIEIAVSAAENSNRNVSVWVSLPGYQADAILKDNSFRSERLPEVGLLIETCTCLSQILDAIQTLENEFPPNLIFFPIASSFYVREDGSLSDGSAIEDSANDALSSNRRSHIVGANCGDTPESFINITARMRQMTRRPILVQPNAGLPEKDFKGTLNYPLDPAGYSDLCMRIADAGANIVGGCCGVAPKHTAHLRKVLDLRRSNAVLKSRFELLE